MLVYIAFHITTTFRGLPPPRPQITDTISFHTHLTHLLIHVDKSCRSVTQCINMESLKDYFKSELKVQMFLLDYPNPADFTLSCWQRNRQFFPLLLWRTFLFITSLTILLSSMITFMIDSIFQFWFIYLTHWGLLFIVVMTGFGVAISARSYFRGPIGKYIHIQYKAIFD